MPSGKVHSAGTVLASAALGIAAYHYGYPVMPLVGGCLAGILITPDLDVDHPTHSHYTMQRAGGCLIGAVWRLLWLPYAKVMPHRSPWSHWPLIGTALRLAYLLWLPMLLNPTWLYLPWLIWAVIGLSCADALHFVMDNTYRPRHFIKRRGIL